MTYLLGRGILLEEAFLHCFKSLASQSRPDQQTRFGVSMLLFGFHPAATYDYQRASLQKSSHTLPRCTSHWAGSETCRARSLGTSGVLGLAASTAQTARRKALSPLNASWSCGSGLKRYQPLRGLSISCKIMRVLFMTQPFLGLFLVVLTHFTQSPRAFVTILTSARQMYEK